MLQVPIVQKSSNKIQYNGNRQIPQESPELSGQQMGVIVSALSKRHHCGEKLHGQHVKLVGLDLRRKVIIIQQMTGQDRKGKERKGNERKGK